MPTHFSLTGHVPCVPRTSTRTRTLLLLDGRKDIFPSWHVPRCVSKTFLPTVSPKQVLPAGDHIDYFQEEPPVLQIFLNMSVFGWVEVVVSIVVGILSLAILEILEPLTCALVRTLTLRRWLLFPFLVQIGSRKIRLCAHCRF